MLLKSSGKFLIAKNYLVGLALLLRIFLKFVKVKSLKITENVKTPKCYLYFPQQPSCLEQSSYKSLFMFVKLVHYGQRAHETSNWNLCYCNETSWIWFLALNKSNEHALKHQRAGGNAKKNFWQQTTKLCSQFSSFHIFHHQKGMLFVKTPVRAPDKTTSFKFTQDVYCSDKQYNPGAPYIAWWKRDLRIICIRRRPLHPLLPVAPHSLMDSFRASACSRYYCWRPSPAKREALAVDKATSIRRSCLTTSCAHAPAPLSGGGGQRKNVVWGKKSEEARFWGGGFILFGFSIKVGHAFDKADQKVESFVYKHTHTHTGFAL